MSAVACEVAVDSLGGVRAATAGGADRIELCGALELGGLTPGPGLVAAARAASPLPLFVMVRPRAGDFVLDAADLEVMARDIGALRALGADGFVFGALTPDGAIDRAATAELCRAAAPQPVTFHRAFDLAADRIAALETLAGLGVARVLSSGGAPRAVDAVAVLAGLVERARGRLTVVAGGGVRAANVARIVGGTGVREVHSSAARTVDGPMRWRGAGVAFPGAGPDGFARRITDPDEVAALVAAVRAL